MRYVEFKHLFQEEPRLRRIVLVMALNLEAYQLGLFDVLLSESDDMEDWLRFADAIPKLSFLIHGY